MKVFVVLKSKDYGYELSDIFSNDEAALRHANMIMKNSLHPEAQVIIADRVNGNGNIEHYLMNKNCVVKVHVKEMEVK